MDSITLSLAALGRRAFFAASASISALLLSPSASAQQVQPLYTSVNDLPGDEVVVMTNVVEYLNGNGVDKIASGGDVIRADRSAYARTELPLSFLDDEHGTGMLILNEYSQDRSRIVWEGTNEWASSRIYRFRIVYTETASSMEGTVYNHWSLDRREFTGSTWVSSVAFTNGVSIARLVGELGILKMASLSPLGSVESYPISELASGVFGTNLVGRLAIEGEGQGGGGGGGGGAVDSVNGKTGSVVLTGADINVGYIGDPPITIAEELSSIGNAVGGHVNDFNNPHYVTADQVGAYTKQETEDRIEEADKAEITDGQNTIKADGTTIREGHDVFVFGDSGPFARKRMLYEDENDAWFSYDAGFYAIRLKYVVSQWQLDAKTGEGSPWSSLGTSPGSPTSTQLTFNAGTLTRESGRTMSALVTADQLQLLAGQTFDFSDNRVLFTALSNIVIRLGGSVVNFPDFN